MKIFWNISWAMDITLKIFLSLTVSKGTKNTRTFFLDPWVPLSLKLQPKSPRTMWPEPALSANAARPVSLWGKQTFPWGATWWRIRLQRVLSGRKHLHNCEPRLFINSAGVEGFLGRLVLGLRCRSDSQKHKPQFVSAVCNNQYLPFYKDDQQSNSIGISCLNRNHICALYRDLLLFHPDHSFQPSPS